MSNVEGNRKPESQAEEDDQPDEWCVVMGVKMELES